MNQIQAIEWALREAREELKRQGEAYRDPRFMAKGWDFDPTGEIRRKAYEKKCEVLRQGIRGLETALKTITAINEFEGAA